MIALLLFFASASASAAVSLCHALSQRSIASGQPFQLYVCSVDFGPEDWEHIYALTVKLRSPPHNATAWFDPTYSWFNVDQHSLSHVQMASVMGCTQSSACLSK